MKHSSFSGEVLILQGNTSGHHLVFQLDLLTQNKRRHNQISWPKMRSSTLSIKWKAMEASTTLYLFQFCCNQKIPASQRICSHKFFQNHNFKSANFQPTINSNCRSVSYKYTSSYQCIPRANLVSTHQPISLYAAPFFRLGQKLHNTSLCFEPSFSINTNITLGTDKYISMFWPC